MPEGSGDNPGSMKEQEDQVVGVAAEEIPEDGVGRVEGGLM